jgi:thiol-disulfide isomerase/thioredoxin
MKKLFLIITATALLTACGEDENSTVDTTSISGNLSSLQEGTEIYLDYLTPTELFPKDTAIVDKEGNYSFDFKVDVSGYYRLRINNQNFVNLILNPGEAPIINGNGTNLMDSYSVEGSKTSQQLKDFNIAIKRDYLFQDSLNKYFQANQNDPQAFIEVQRRSIGSENQLKEYYMGIINEDPSTLMSLAAVQQLDAEVYFEQYKKVDEALAKTMANTPYYTYFHQKVESLSKLAPGGEAPNFTLNDKDGNPMSLSDLKGKVVLVDFWASWCRPCRAENPNVVKAYNKYKSKGFDVMSVSLDGMPQQQNAKGDWLAAIEKDGLIWKNHVSDLRGWQSAVVPMYGIEGIPFTLLIDKEGKIIAKNLRGNALELKLEEIFG